MSKPVFIAWVLAVAACGRSDFSGPAPGVFVAVGKNGGIYTSAEGSHWQKAESPVTTSLVHLARGAGRLVVVGQQGTVLSSTDGTRWAIRSCGTTLDLTAVTYTGDRFIAVAADWSEGTLAFESPDGETWSRVPAPSSHMMWAVVARSDDQVLAFGTSRSDRQEPQVFSRARGGPFERLAGGPRFLHGATDEAGRTVLVGDGDGAVSNDGLTWADLALEGAHAVATSGSGFVAVGERARVFTSGDGLTWQTHTAATPNAFIPAVAWGAGRFVAVTEQGVALSPPETALGVAVGGAGINDLAFGP